MVSRRRQRLFCAGRQIFRGGVGASVPVADKLPLAGVRVALWASCAAIHAHGEVAFAFYDTRAAAEWAGKRDGGDE